MGSKELNIVGESYPGTRDFNTDDAVQEELRWDVSSRIASDLSGLNASQLCENQE